MINLSIFCLECTPWLVLMLLGAWMLGWLLWSLIKGTPYKETITDQETQITDLKKKNTDLHTDLTNEKYSLEKRNGEYDSLRAKHMDLDLKFKVQKESLTDLTTAYEKLKLDFDALKS